MSPDPIVQNPKDVQAYNRYAYVRNNPMTNIDPSGYSYIGDNKHRIGEGMVYVGSAMSFAPPPVNFIGVGMVATGQHLMGDTRGAAITAFVAIASYGIGQSMSGADGISKGRAAFRHGVVGGIAAELQGGKFQHGFLSSWATKHVMSLDALTSGGTDFSDRLGRVSLAAMVGGTISEVTGGKFANGARTAALQQLFNQETQMPKRYNGTFDLSGIEVSVDAASQEEFEAIKSLMVDASGTEEGGKLINSFIKQHGKGSMSISTQCGSSCAKANGVASSSGGNVRIKLSMENISNSTYIGSMNRITPNSLERVLIHEAYGHGFGGFGKSLDDHKAVRAIVNSINSELNPNFVKESFRQVQRQGYD